VRTAAVLTAAGSGSRLGHPVPKALAPLHGTPLVAHAAARLIASGVVDLLVVTTPPDHLDALRAAVSRASGGQSLPVLWTVGGPSRQASVAAALALLPDDVDVVLVHDAARALAPSTLVADVAAAVRAGHGAVIPALPVTDTVVEVAVEPPVEGDGADVGDDRVFGSVGPVRSSGSVGSAGSVARVVATPVRSALRAVQTPQGFDRVLLQRAHRAASARAADESLAATDDSSLVGLLGEPVVTVPGHELAMKITTPRDLAVAALLLSGEARVDGPGDGPGQDGGAPIPSAGGMPTTVGTGSPTGRDGTLTARSVSGGAA
jgi:2-C-methyl-D-erythritol 4-phosphate cytidylyltransferase